MNYKAKCAIGKRGIGYKKKEGDLITPIGKYKIKYVLYRKDRIKKFQTKLKKISIIITSHNTQQEEEHQQSQDTSHKNNNNNNCHK